MGYGQGMKPNRESTSGGGGAPLLDSLLQPLRDLQQQYTRALELVERIEAELDAVVSRVAESEMARDASARPRTPGPPTPKRPPLARLQVHFPNQEALLLFEQRVSALDGVASVTVAGSTPTESTLLVELFGPGGPASPATAPTIVCTNCGRVLFEGSAEISHGLCPDCLREFGSVR